MSLKFKKVPVFNCLRNTLSSFWVNMMNVSHEELVKRSGKSTLLLFCQGHIQKERSKSKEAKAASEAEPSRPARTLR